jgi:hypothetical protein
MMKKSQRIAAHFKELGQATGAIDWFRNQAIDASAIGAFAVPPDGQPRPPRAGDNARTDLGWIVSLDLDQAKITRQDAADTLRREGGSLIGRAPDG